MRTESVAALLAGGIAFDVPEFAKPGANAASAKAMFTLYRYRAIAMKEPDPFERRYVLYFNESVRGLSTGAPVTLFGLQVGEVTDVGLDFDRKTQVFRPRVIVTLYPERLVAELPTGQRTRAGKSMADMSGDERTGLLRRIVEQQGLRAQLRTGSLLTGELYVAFEYFPDAARRRSTGRRIRWSCRWSRAASRASRRSSAASSPRSTRCRSTRLAATCNGTCHARHDLERREHAGQSSGYAMGARGHEDARGSSPRHQRRQPGGPECGRHALQQGFAGTAGPARHAAGGHPGGAEHPRARRLSRTSPGCAIRGKPAEKQ